MEYSGLLKGVLQAGRTRSFSWSDDPPPPENERLRLECVSLHGRERSGPRGADGGDRKGSLQTDSVCCQTETRSNYGAESCSLCFHGFHQPLLLKYAITCSNYSFHCITLCCHCNTAVGGGRGVTETASCQPHRHWFLRLDEDRRGRRWPFTLAGPPTPLGEACPSPAGSLVPPHPPNPPQPEAEAKCDPNWEPFKGRRESLAFDVTPLNSYQGFRKNLQQNCALNLSSFTFNSSYLSFVIVCLLLCFVMDVLCPPPSKP